ncbi:MAG: DUF3822 family protein [Bacteroidales bacterium]
MPSISAIDDAFDSRNSSVCQLSIQYGAQLFSFAILDLLSNRYLALRHYWFNSPVSPENQADHLRILLNSEGYLLRPYDRIHFLYLSPSSVIIPDDLYIEGKESSYFLQQQQVPDDHVILHSPIKEVSSRLLFPIPSTVHEYLTTHLDRVGFYHQSCPLIQSCCSDPTGEGGTSRAALFAGPGFIDMALFSGNGLILYNSYPAGSTEEAIYYILYVFNQFGLIHEETPLEISGFIENFPGADRLLGQYIRHITYGRFNTAFRFSPAFTTLTPHHFNLLLNLPQCG